MNGYPIFFQEVPPVGTKVNYHGLTLTLSRVGQYPSKKGGLSPLLEWSAEDGRVATSGLRGKSVYWRSIDEALAARAEVSQ